MLGMALAAQATAFQDRLDFSGKWTVVTKEPAQTPQSAADDKRPRSPIRIAPAPSFGSEFTARQDASTLAIEHRILGNLSVVTYRLDGSNSENDEGPFKTVSTATWLAGKLVITTRFQNSDPNPDNQLTRLLWLDADGRLLVQTVKGTGTPETTVYRRPGT
jgi:hypothetical protein